MSGVYIPNIEIPKSCDDCPHPTCTLWQSVNGGERNEKCPIVPAPEHGRLIDADALLKGCKRVTTEYATREYAFSQSAIENAPTILPPEEAET